MEISEENKLYMKAPRAYSWVQYDLSNIDHCTEVAKFLNTHYTESNKNVQIQHTPEFLQWFFSKPGQKTICIGLRTKTNKLLGACVIGQPIKMQINYDTMDMVDIHFLCVHSTIRGRKVAKKLIEQLKTLFSDIGCNKAVYGSTHHEGVCTTKYFSRPINIDSLLECGLMRLENNITKEDIVRTHYISEEYCFDEDLDIGLGHIERNFVKMVREDVDHVHDLFNKYMNQYHFHVVYTKEEFEYIFCNNDFVTSYIAVEDDCIVDFISYYKLPIKVKKDSEEYTLTRGFLYYYTNNTETSYRLVSNMLVAAKQEGIDDLIMSDIMENQILDIDLHFLKTPFTMKYCIQGYEVYPETNNKANFLTKQVCKVIIL